MRWSDQQQMCAVSGLIIGGLLCYSFDLNVLGSVLFGLCSVVVMVGVWHEYRNAVRAHRAAERNHRMGRYRE